MVAPAVVDFPLRGEWNTPNTPGEKIPSHGTDFLAQTYAIDFVGLDPDSRSMKFYRSGFLQYLIRGVPLRDCFGWGQPIYSATDGVVIRAEDGIPERDPVNLFRDLSIMSQNARSAGTGERVEYSSLAGNFIIIESPVGYAVYAHAQTGSIRVSVGDRVDAGQWLANVGHSGNSTAPHLHFQLMDQPDPWVAKGLPCCFAEYEVLTNGVWQPVHDGIPTAKQRIRKM